MSTKEIIDSVRCGRVADQDLKSAILFYRHLASLLETLGPTYQLMWRPVFDTACALEENAKFRGYDWDLPLPAIPNGMKDLILKIRYGDGLSFDELDTAIVFYGAVLQGLSILGEPYHLAWCQIRDIYMRLEGYKRARLSVG